MKRIGTREQLERALDAIMARANGTLALAAKNLATGEEIERNADRVMPTASVFKLPLLVEVFRQAESGALDLGERVALRPEDIVGGSGILRDLGAGLQPTLRDMAMLMIVLSDNTATNILLDRVGGREEVNGTMRDLGLASIVTHRRLAFGGAPLGPVAEAAPRDLKRLVTMMARGELVSAEASQAMKAILSRQRYLDQVPRFIAYQRYAADFGRSQPIAVFNKTGTIGGLRADTGLIAIGEETEIAYSVVNDAGDETSYRNEHAGDITNALVGRVLVEYWWPGEWQPELTVHPSPYVDELFAATGL